jgi:hypothetical protein
MFTFAQMANPKRSFASFRVTLTLFSKTKCTNLTEALKEAP